MGIETVLFLGLTALKASQQISAGRDQAKDINDIAAANAKVAVAEGDIASKNKAQEVALKAARTTSSFLSSGLTLEGTPMSAIQNTFDVGLEDVNQIISNTSARSRNIVAQGVSQASSAFETGRSAAMETVVSGVSGASFGSLGGGTAGTTSAAGFGSTGTAGIGKAGIFPSGVGGGGSNIVV